MTDQTTDKTSTANGSGNSGAPAGSVTDPNPATADTGSELDTLLKQFNEGTAQNDLMHKFVKVISAQDKQNEPIRNYVLRDAQEKASAQEQEDLKAAKAHMRKEAGVPEEFPEALVDGILWHSVSSDPAASRAWNDRYQNPDGWKVYLSKATTRLADSHKAYPTTTVRVISDEERAMASVRGVSTEPPRAEVRNPVLDFRLSDQEWERVQASELAKQRTG